MMGFCFGGSAETRTPVLLVLPIKDYTFIQFFKTDKIHNSLIFRVVRFTEN